MKIEVYSIVNNDVKLIPYFMRHYSQFADVILFDTNSTDGTAETGEKLGAEVNHCEINELDDLWMVDLKNNCWKKSKADWVMIADADEFIYHKDIIGYLEKCKATIIEPRFINMFSDKFPTTERQIYEEVTMGTEKGSIWWGTKINIFRPDKIREINYNVGCHGAHPVGEVIPLINPEIITLHMRFLSKEYVIEKHKRHNERVSKTNKLNGWGYYPGNIEKEVSAYMDEAKNRLMKII